MNDYEYTHFYGTRRPASNSQDLSPIPFLTPTHTPPTVRLPNASTPPSGGAPTLLSLLLLLLDNLCRLYVLHQHRGHVSIVSIGRTRLFWSLDIVVDRNDPIRE